MPLSLAINTLLSVRCIEDAIVSGVRAEGRVEVDQVHAFRGDVVAQDGEVVAVIEVVRHARPLRFMGILSGGTG